jgi:thymidylate synthase
MKTFYTKNHKKNSTSYITLIFCIAAIVAVAVGHFVWTLFVSLAG